VGITTRKFQGILLFGSPPFETGKVAGDASSRFVTEEQQTPAAFIVDSERTYQKVKNT